MKGIRKLVVFGAVVVAMLLGFACLAFATKQVSDVAFASFIGGLVGAGGWFFKANIDEHKTAQTLGSGG